jgi:hypothetical protein
LGISLTSAKIVTGRVFLNAWTVAYPQATPAKSTPTALAATASLTSSPIASVAEAETPAARITCLNFRA